jgi:hypothetical protein
MVRARDRSKLNNIAQKGNRPMIITHKHLIAIAAGLSIATFPVPSLAQSRANRVSTEREAAIAECNHEANGEYPWYEDMNRADAYRACMTRHAQAE